MDIAFGVGPGMRQVASFISAFFPAFAGFWLQKTC